MLFTTSNFHPKDTRHEKKQENITNNQEKKCSQVATQILDFTDKYL